MGQRPRVLDPAASPLAGFGALLRSWRVRRGLSQDGLGRLTHVSGDLLSKIEKAERRPLPDLVARLDAALEAGGELAGAAAVLDARPDRARRARTRARPGIERDGGGLPDGLPDGRDGGDLLGGALGRRALGAVAVRALSACAAATAEAGANPRWPHRGRGVRGGGGVDRGWLGEQVAVGQALAGLYRGSDPRLVLPVAMAYADALLETVHHGPGSAGGAGGGRRAGDLELDLELVDLVVGVHAQVGLWSVHADRPGQARRYLACAREVAEAGPDRVLRARALGALSYLYSSAPRGGCGGDPRRALGLLDEAMGLAEHADGFTRGWLATWRADQHAAVGDQVRARADLDVARQGLDRPDGLSSPDGLGGGGQVVGFFARDSYGYGMRAHLDSVQALTDALGGRVGAAEDGFARVQAGAANDRRRAATHAHRALGYVRGARPDADAAAAAVRSAVETSVQAGYAMGLRRAVGVRAGFDPGWEHLDCVRDVDDLINQLTGQDQLIG